MSKDSGVECWASVHTLKYGTTRTADLSALRSGRALLRRKFFILILLEAEWAQDLLNADRRDSSLENCSGTLSEIEPGNSRLVAQCFNQMRHALVVAKLSDTILFA